jgi:hypothetical protein
MAVATNLSLANPSAIKVTELKSKKVNSDSDITLMEVITASGFNAYNSAPIKDSQRAATALKAKNINDAITESRIIWNTTTTTGEGSLQPPSNARKKG